MRKRMAALLAVLVCAAGMTGMYRDWGRAFAAEMNEMSTEIGKETMSQEVEKIIEKVAGSMEFQGTILAAKGDEILFAKGYGLADAETGEKNTVDTVYAVGSVSKQFTAAAVLKLAEEGKINLSETIDHYFPGYSQGSRVTVKHLLNMQSGIERDFWNIAYRAYGYTTMDQADAFQEQQHTKEELLDLLYQDELQFQPGSQYMYSNINYYLLYLIAEQAAGMRFQDYIRENFFVPYGMESAVMDFEEPLAAGYYDGRKVRENASLYEGCGTVCAGVLDLFRWNRALHEGEILSKASYRVMTDAGPGNYACGVLVEDTLIWHNGQLNGYNSYNCYDKEDEWMLIVLSNSRTYPFHGQVADFPAETAAKVIWRQLKG